MTDLAGNLRVLSNLIICSANQTCSYDNDVVAFHRTCRVTFLCVNTRTGELNENLFFYNIVHSGQSTKEKFSRPKTNPLRFADAPDTQQHSGMKLNPVEESMAVW